jgi:hypothetical protein
MKTLLMNLMITKNVYENPVYHYENSVMVPNYGYESSYEFCWKFDPK